MGKSKNFQDVNLDFKKVNQLLNVILHKITNADEVSVLTALAQLAYNKTTERVKIKGTTVFNATTIRTLLQDNDISDNADFTQEGSLLVKRSVLKTYIDSRIAGLLDFKGAYDASNDTPHLDSPTIIASEKGDAYIVSVGGNFFNEVVEAGDFLISTKDSPILLTDWIRIQFNLDLAVVLADYPKRFSSPININQFQIVSVVSTTKTIVVTGDATSLLSNGSKFDLEDSAVNDTTLVVSGTPIYSAPNTTIVVTTNPTADSGADGQINVFADIFFLNSNIGDTSNVAVTDSDGRWVNVDISATFADRVEIRSNVPLMSGQASFNR